MVVKYNTEKLEKITKALFTLTGMSVAILDNNSEFICMHTKKSDFCTRIQQTPEVADKCVCSDRYLIKKCTESGKHESHICHAGLYDAILPIKKNDALVCYVLMGRVRCERSPAHFDGCCKKDEFYQQTPFFTEDKIKSMASLLSNILFDEAVYIEIDNIAEQIAQYIKQHFAENLSIGHLCEKFFISKNSLYKLFRNYYGITVNEYVTTVRLEEAKKLLSETEDSVYCICDKIGFRNSAYFCRLFKKRFRQTPAQYRKENRFVSVRDKTK